MARTVRFSFRFALLRSTVANRPPIPRRQNDPKLHAALAIRFSETAALCTLIMSVEVTAAEPFGVWEAGLKLHEAIAGRPEQAKLIWLLNPPVGVIETVALIKRGVKIPHPRHWQPLAHLVGVSNQ